MKLSIEAKVAAAIAVAFAVLSMGAIAREQSERGTAATSSGAALSQVSLADSSSESRAGTGKDEVLGLY